MLACPSIYSSCFIRTLFVSLVILITTSCSIFHAPEKKPTQQPAQFLLHKMHEQQVSSSQALLTLFKTKAVQSHLPKQTKKAVNKYPKIAADILLTLDKNAESKSSIIELIEQKKKKQNTYIYVVLTMYPVDGYRLAEKLAASDKIDNETITTASLRAGFDPAIISPPTAANNDSYRIVPLMESASITLYNQTENASADIQFKAQNDTQWQQGLALQWEPIQGALSGSIVYLKPNTQYQVKVSLSENGVLLSEEQYSFTTRAESPPIDPDKIYYLSEIYQGGQLDIEALGIEGNANGWAKIIGDGVTIQAEEGDNSAVYIGRQNYIMLENITTKGGFRYGIHGYKAHHIWIKGANISEFGRVATEYREGKGYETVNKTGLINYDSGIYLERSGVVVIENSEIHSPNGKANSWEYGHPNGPNAFQIWGYHDTEAYRGQYIVRNNRFYGTPEKRFNDVIEGRSNFKRSGAFVRDSAIYNNYLAYANDDLIEMDGGQANVLFYNNELTQGYCGISTAPNMIGPSYIFHNYIHDLGDERGKEWAAIKMGGIMSRPAGITNVLENLIITNRNGIAAARVDNDSTFWVNAQNNIFINREYNSTTGYGIYDKQLYGASKFENNVIYNTDTGSPIVRANIGDNFYHPLSESPSGIGDVLNEGNAYQLAIESGFIIPNFSQRNDTTNKQTADISVNNDATLSPINLSHLAVTSYDNQDRTKAYEISEDGLQITLSGNTWKSVPYIETVNPSTIVELDLSHNGIGEIIGIAFETDNKLTNSRLFKFFGSQDWQSNGPETTLINETETLTLNLGQYITGPINRLVFAMDYDDAHGATVPNVTFSNIKIYEPSAEPDTSLGDNTDAQQSVITIGKQQ
ncbi:right-handed parallel beta-helix repeat-containing protein [Paraglaciecola chathamensis]|uniref:right-handed parallel beta-helix repeat-containing protein n=1 Tax=Paraglaciecola chathamensis TaxID=368405 RepID=UPI0026FFAD5F|nr:right-handed parallel beta-helix repeat-containing protein [Paraglaciecola chathamensis]MDO6559201.1 right-handed parallel beta-helix repeat-containing protein [Paraglaciecola chathamensis]